MFIIFFYFFIFFFYKNLNCESFKKISFEIDINLNNFNGTISKTCQNNKKLNESIYKEYKKEINEEIIKLNLKDYYILLNIYKKYPAFYSYGRNKEKIKNCTNPNHQFIFVCYKVENLNFSSDETCSSEFCYRFAYEGKSNEAKDYFKCNPPYSEIQTSDHNNKNLKSIMKIKDLEYIWNGKSGGKALYNLYNGYYENNKPFAFICRREKKKNESLNSNQSKSKVFLILFFFVLIFIILVLVLILFLFKKKNFFFKTSNDPQVNNKELGGDQFSTKISTYESIDDNFVLNPIEKQMTKEPLYVEVVNPYKNFNEINGVYPSNLVYAQIEGNPPQEPKNFSNDLLYSQVNKNLL